MTRDVLPVIGDLPVVEIRRHIIHDLVQSIAARAPRVASMVKTELHGAFEYAISAGRLPMDFVNPTIGVKGAAAETTPPGFRRR